MEDVQPSSIEAERAFLSALIMGGYTHSDTFYNLHPKDFFRGSHAKLFEVIKVMLDNHEPIEMSSIVSKLIALDSIEEAGGIGYLQSLFTNSASSLNIDYYGTQIQEASVRRRLLVHLKEINEMTLNPTIPLSEVLEFTEGKVFELTQTTDNKDWQQINTVVDQEFSRIQSLVGKASDVTGFTTGFADLDKILAGLHKTDLIILAARPGMGKTALVLNIALNAAKTGVGIGVFSLEMSSGQLVTRLLCIESRVDAGRVRTGKLSLEADMPRLFQASESLFVLPIYIDDTPGANIQQVRSKARRLKALNPNLGLIIVDYIGLMSGDSKMSRQEQVAASSRGLKGLAKELDVCVIALSQLNRSVEQRNDKRPVPSDLRESGAIEQDADIISFIYRDDYYNKDSEEQGIAEIIIAKQRNGSTGTIKLLWQGSFTRFDNLIVENYDYV